MDDCHMQLVGLVLLSVSLLLSLCFNVIYCIRKGAVLCRDTDECHDPHNYNGESLSQSQVHYSHNLHHHEQQENPIYGNISTDRRGSLDVCYEMVQHTRDSMKSLEPDLNYASLELKVARKHRKQHRHQQGHAQAGNNLQDQLPVHLASPVNSYLEVETDTEAQLPSRDASAMVPHSHIYLNCQEIAQETEDLERERGVSIEMENEGKGEQEGEEREDHSNGSVHVHHYQE